MAPTAVALQPQGHTAAGGPFPSSPSASLPWGRQLPHPAASSPCGLLPEAEGASSPAHVDHKAPSAPSRSRHEGSPAVLPKQRQFCSVGPQVRCVTPFSLPSKRHPFLFSAPFVLFADAFGASRSSSRSTQALCPAANPTGISPSPRCPPCSFPCLPLSPFPLPSPHCRIPRSGSAEGEEEFGPPQW